MMIDGRDQLAVSSQRLGAAVKAAQLVRRDGRCDARHRLQEQVT
jgi:hypothetical protein